MDWLTTVIGIGSFLIAAVVLFLISVFSFKERTYEEALAEQHKFAESLWKGDKGNKEKKAKKGTKKSKEKDRSSADGSNQMSVDSAAEEKLHVEFEPDAEIIPEEQPQSDKEKKKNEKKEKVKPILRNRDGHSPVPAEAIIAELSFDPDVNSANHFIENPPKDAVELKAKEKHKYKGSKGVDPSDPDLVEPIVQKENAFTVGRVAGNTSAAAVQQQQTVLPPQGTPKKHQRKKASSGKSDSLDTVDAGEELLMQLGGSEKLLSAIRRVPLSASDLQSMIEVLLNRQQEANDAVESEWIERGGRLDPMSSLKKQLAEKEKALQEQQEVAQVYQNKLRSLGSEISSERTRAAQARKQLEETINKQSTEIQLLNARLQQTSEQYTAEVSALRNSLQSAQKASQATEEHVRQQQRLLEDKNQLENRCAIAQKVHQELSSRVQQLEDLLRLSDQQLRECEVKRQNAVSMMEMQATEIEQMKTALKLETGQSHEAQKELVKLREALNASEAQSLRAVHDAHARCEEIERNRTLLEERLNSTDKELIEERGRSGQIERELHNEIHRLREQNEGLLNDLQRSQQRLQNEQETIENMHSQLNRFQDELENQKRKNNELREKNYAAMNALTAAEKSLLEFKKSKANELSSQEIQETLVLAAQRLFPDCNLDVQSNFQSFVKNFEMKIQGAIERFQKEEQSKAQTQVLHYKTVLSQTEELLNRLQNRVESEEKTWKARLLDLENELSSSRQERNFWMQQCQQFELDQQLEHSNKEENKSLQNKLDFLQTERDHLLKELDEERSAASILKTQLANEKSILETTQEALEQEKLTVHVLKQQIEQFKAEVAAAKVGSIGYMVGWAKGHSSAATVAVATIRNSLNLETCTSEVNPTSLQVRTASLNPAPVDTVSKSGISAVNTNGVALSAEDTKQPIPELTSSSTSSNSSFNGIRNPVNNHNRKGKNRRKKDNTATAS